MHARVALYDLTTGTADEIVRRAEADDGMVAVFHEQDGFVSYELIESDGTIVSISRWTSAQQADAATEAAALWVKENLTELVELRQNLVGDVVLSTG